MSSIRKRPNGSWRARYRDASGKEHAAHWPTKREAQRWLDEVTATVVTGRYVDPKAGTVLLRDYYAVWASRQLWETGTRAAMDLAIRSCAFAGDPLRAVKRSDVETWVKAMQKAGLAPLTVHQRVQNVRTVLRGAIRDRLIVEDPTAGVTLPRKRRREAAMVIPSTDDVRALHAAAEAWFRPFVLLGAFAGLRFGEINGAQLGDIDFLRRTMAVRRQVQRRAPHPIEVRPPKWGSERSVPMADGLLEQLSRHVQDVGVYGDDRWLLVGRDGGPAWPRRLAYEWGKTRDRAGLSELDAHSLRHFYASGLIAAGCDVVTVQRALGHHSASVTLNTYAHLWPTGEDRTRAAAQGLLESAFGAPADSVRTAGPSAGPDPA